MIKVYELSRYDAMTLRVVYMNQTIMVNFRGGVKGRNRASFTTNSAFVQDAIESDPRYGSLFTMVRKYEDIPSSAAKIAADKAKPRRITKVRTVNDALLYLSQLGAAITGEADLSDLMERYNVEFPNLKR